MVGISVSVSELVGESELVFLLWRQVPFSDFFERLDSRQAASGILECPVAASLLLGFSSAKFSNRRISECSVAASEIGALVDEPAGLQHLSLHLILLSSVFVNHFFETIIDSA